MEIYKAIQGYETLYEVSDLGNVKSLLRDIFNSEGKRLRSVSPRILKPYKMPNGYLHVCLSKDGTDKSARIHILEANAFIPNPNNLPEINHLDGNKENNVLTNLERSTHQNNIIHSFANGLSKQGAAHYAAKVTVEQVMEMRSEYIEGRSLVWLAAKYNISDRTVWQIVKNKTWKSIL